MDADRPGRRPARAQVEAPGTTPRRGAAKRQAGRTPERHDCRQDARSAEAPVLSVDARGRGPSEFNGNTGSRCRSLPWGVT
jgi:hypothetical protein